MNEYFPQNSGLVSAGLLEGGERGEPVPMPAPEPVTNTAFLLAIYAELPTGTHAVVCTKPGDPTQGGWSPMPSSAAHSRCLATNNNYLNCSTFRVQDGGELRAKKENFAACHFLMLDDIGTKVPMEILDKVQPSWLIETSPGNHQAGLIFKEPLTELQTANTLLKAIIKAGMCDEGSTGPASRWARLPVGINGKQKYRKEDGSSYHCTLKRWSPEVRYTPGELAAALNLDLTNPAAPPTRRAARSRSEASPLLTPSAAENPVVTALKSHGLYKRLLEPRKHDITCPWVEEHTDALDTGAAYFEPNEAYPVGGYCCQHSHKDKYRISELLQHLGISFADARNKPIINVTPGAMHECVDAAERVLAETGKYYQAGGLIASVGRDPATGDPAIIPVNPSALALELCKSAEWLLETNVGPKPTDPPSKHIKALHESQVFRHLPVLTGFARQPYFRDGGQLVMTAGYDREACRIGVFDARKFELPEPSRSEGERALAVLKELLAEFHFSTEQDRAVALSAILTASVRPSLALAPAFHVQASTPGSGKTYLCELIGLFASPAPNQKVTYPTTAEEASKVMLAVLLPGPAVVEFDDMDADWKPFSAVKRVLTAPTSSDRILGASKTATVSTRTLFLGSGNNVGPARDLLRRVMTIRLEPQVESPSTLQYRTSPVARVRRHRERYVAAALTIIRSWQAAGSPRTVSSIASYGDLWADYCRHPLIWLGVSDPVETIVAQLRADPDQEVLGRFMKKWSLHFGDESQTVRKVKDTAHVDEELFDAIAELPKVVEPRLGINSNKLGWYLKRNLGRVVNGRKFERVETPERTAWALVPAGSGSPPSPPSSPPAATPPAEERSESAVREFELPDF